MEERIREEQALKQEDYDKGLVSKDAHDRSWGPGDVVIG